MATVLGVLGFVGMLLLTLLGFVLAFMLVVMLTVMFVPLGYDCEGNIHGKGFSGVAKAWWLFGLLRLEFDSTNEQPLQLKLAGIRAWSGANTNEEEPKPRAAKSTLKKRQRAQTQRQELSSSKGHKQTEETHPEGFFAGIKRTWASVWGTVKAIKDYPERKEIVSACKLLLSRTLKAATPTRLDLGGTFGLEDPSHTGMLLGAISALAPLSPRWVSIAPRADFLGKALDLRLNVAGRLRLASFVSPMLKFVVSRPIRNLIKTLLRRQREHGKQLQQQHRGTTGQA